MNAGRDVERLIADWFVEEAVLRAPDRVLEDAGRVIDRTRQRRLGVAWRSIRMSAPLRLAATAAIGVLVVAGALMYFGGTNRSNVGGAPGPTAPATSSPGASPGAVHAIPAGVYATEPMDVADILVQLDADQSLSEAQKQSIVRDVLVIDGRTTLASHMFVRDDEFDMRLSRDGGTPEQDTTFTVTWLDDQSFQMETPCCGRTTYGVTWEGDAFRLDARTPASSNVETFVRRILFESQPFVPVQ